MTSRLHVYISGGVQGVGFRQSTQIKAEELGVNGWVKNLPDGRVEAEFEGEKEALDMMLSWCKKGPAAATVDQVDADWETGNSRYRTFRVSF